MDRDRLAAFVALVEIVAFKHSGHSMFCSQLHHTGGPDIGHPLGVEQHLRAVRVEDLEHLLTVAPGVFANLIRVSGGRVWLFPVGSPIIPVKSPIRNRIS